jgi:glutamyl-tRNA synthetase
VSNQVRVRFAPSPTGHLHIGGARTALFNWFFARNKGGKFILRIEDTDLERSTEESYRAIVDAMRWLGLDWDEGPTVGGDLGPYFQSERRQTYRELAHRLLAEDKAYYCFCTSDDLHRMREALKKEGKDPKYDRRCRDLGPDEIQRRMSAGTPHVVRFKAPLGGETTVEDLVRGTVTFSNPQLDDFVLMKSNGYPTYNFAAAVDDTLMKITHIIRGEDHLPNTPKQILLYHAFGVETPAFAHVPLILGPDGSRLSKRHGATSVAQFEADGYLPEAMVNYLALLGWAYDDRAQVFETKDLIAKFSLDKVSAKAAVFDYKKLLWMDGEYMKQRPVEDRVALVTPHLEKAGLIKSPLDESTKDYLGRVVGAVGERLKVGFQIVELAGFFFRDDIEYDPEAVAKVLKRHYVPAALRVLEDRLQKIERFDLASIEPVLRGLAQEMGLKAGDLFQPVRVAITGTRQSPGLFETMVILGKERVLKRLAYARHSLT